MLGARHPKTCNWRRMAAADHESALMEVAVKNAISERLHALMPRASEAMVGLLKEQRVKERLYTTAARDVISDDAIVNNLGVSSAYQSPSHLDHNDLGWIWDGRRRSR